jgi:ParB-like chromosome segregation protein Spo0J
MKGKFADGLEKLLTPIEKIQVAKSNPRRGDIDAVARSYKTFGQRKPIVVRKEKGGKGTAIAGNHQLQAARKLGWTHIAAIWVEEDEMVSKAFALADNRTHDLGTYDTVALLALLEEVKGEEKLLAATAYTEDDMSDLVASIEEDTEISIDDLLELNDRFSKMASRMFVVELSNEEFVWAQNVLEKYRENKKLESNAVAFIKALEKVTNKRSPKWN